MPKREDDPEPTGRVEPPGWEERLSALKPKELRELATRHGVEVRGLRRKSEVVSALVRSPAAGAIRRELETGPGDAPRIQEELAATRDLIHEAANLGAAVGVAEDAWNDAAQALGSEDYRAARERLTLAARRATEARERRIRDIEEGMGALEDHITLARKVGADVTEAERLRAQAGTAMAAREFGRAGVLLKRAEREAMMGQQRQIQRAIELREQQMERARALVAGCEPLVREAESYGLDVGEVRTLLRQARDVLGQGDYVSGILFARNAEEATYRLQARVEEERQRRGLQRPRSGICGKCSSDRLTFYDDGWGRCDACGTTFRWRSSRGVRERVRGLLGT